MGTWSYEQRRRLALEEQILERELPGFSFRDHASFGLTTVRGSYTSSAGNVYTLCLWLTEGFPHEMPKLYVLYPSPLYDYWGKPMTSYGASHAMHTWVPDWEKYVKICHWKSEFWSASNTVISVLMKGLLWLEAFEAHRQTGESIDAYSRKWSEGPVG